MIVERILDLLRNKLQKRLNGIADKIETTSISSTGIKRIDRYFTFRKIGAFYSSASTISISGYVLVAKLVDSRLFSETWEIYKATPSYLKSLVSSAIEHDPELKPKSGYSLITKFSKHLKKDDIVAVVSVDRRPWSIKHSIAILADTGDSITEESKDIEVILETLLSSLSGTDERKIEKDKIEKPQTKEERYEQECTSSHKIFFFDYSRIQLQPICPQCNLRHPPLKYGDICPVKNNLDINCKKTVGE